MTPCLELLLRLSCSLNFMSFAVTTALIPPFILSALYSCNAACIRYYKLLEGQMNKLWS